MKRNLVKTTASATLFAGLLLLAPLSLRAQNADSEEVTQLFTQIRQHAVLAENDAELLESYILSSVSWQSHARRIKSMRVHVNDLIGDFNKAKELRSVGSPRQQAAIDHLEPLLQSMADHLSSSIEHLNTHQSQVKMPPWPDYVRANHEYATRTATLIRDYLDYEEASTKVEDLEKKLVVPTTPGE